MTRTVKTERLSIRLTPELKQSLKDIADKEIRSISNIIELAIIEYINKQTEKNDND